MGEMGAARGLVDRLCRDYAVVPAEELRVEGRRWLAALAGAPEPELREQAGWLALLVGCVEYDLGLREPAEQARAFALTVGTAEIAGWAYEMAAWFALCEGDYRGAVAAGDAGLAVAGGYGVAAQLAAQQAKAWARLGDRGRAEAALARSRAVPLPARTDGGHFDIDAGKRDAYAMECYRVLGDDRRAEAYARAVLAAGTNPDGTDRSPMRNAEARLTLAVVAARRGDVDGALALAGRALAPTRRSVPSLRSCAADLVAVLPPPHPAALTAALGSERRT